MIRRLGWRLIEISIIGAFGLLGWSVSDGGVLGAVSAIAIGAAAAALCLLVQAPEIRRWPTASLKVSGPVRLALEIVLVGVAAFSLWTNWNRAAAETFLTLVVIQYAFNWEHVANLLGRDDSAA